MAECKPLKKEDYEYFTNELNRAWGILKDNERLYFESRKKR